MPLHRKPKLSMMSEQDKAAQRGNPSYVWREGQVRRLEMIRQGAQERMYGRVFEVGCGLGQYLQRIQPQAALAIGLDVEHDRLQEALPGSDGVLLALGEHLPLNENEFDLVLCNEVLEHVEDDVRTVSEMVRVLKPGGRLIVFVPNRGYPFETHGIYRKGQYQFGNKFAVNYLPRRWRDRLAPHVRVYARRDLQALFNGLPVRFIQRTVIFGGYDNIVMRLGVVGKIIRWLLHTIEKTPLRVLGLSHLWVVEKV